MRCWSRRAVCIARIFPTRPSRATHCLKSGVPSGVERRMKADQSYSAMLQDMLLHWEDIFTQHRLKAHERVAVKYAWRLQLLLRRARAPCIALPLV